MTNTPNGGLQALALIPVLIGVATAVFWMVVGWRAMRAHERLADAAERRARQTGSGEISGS